MLSVSPQIQRCAGIPGSTDGCMFGEIRENCVNLSDAAFYLKDIVRSKMNSPALHVRLRQTLLVPLACVNAVTGIGYNAPKIKSLS